MAAIGSTFGEASQVAVPHADVGRADHVSHEKSADEDGAMRTLEIYLIVGMVAVAAIGACAMMGTACRMILASLATQWGA
jgi:Flp pilus assembly pilin Flp